MNALPTRWIEVIEIYVCTIRVAASMDRQFLYLGGGLDERVGVFPSVSSPFTHLVAELGRAPHRRSPGEGLRANNRV